MILLAVLLAIGLALVGLSDLVAATAFAALVAIVMLAFLFLRLLLCSALQPGLAWGASRFRWSRPHVGGAP